MSDLSQEQERSQDRLIVGLGNPGSQYHETRHNLGFRVVNQLAERWGKSLSRLECSALIAERAGGLLAEPQTYMNRSGYAVRCLVERRMLSPSNLLVVYDDVNLPLGRVRLRPAGGPGGHRGMESIVQNLRTEEIARLRLGVAPRDRDLEGEALVDFVLAPFDESETETVTQLIDRATDACESWWSEGNETTMNRYNG